MRTISNAILKFGVVIAYIFNNITLLLFNVIVVLFHTHIDQYILLHYIRH